MSKEPKSPQQKEPLLDTREQLTDLNSKSDFLRENPPSPASKTPPAPTPPPKKEAPKEQNNE